MPVNRRVNSRTWASIPWPVLLFVLPIVFPLWAVWVVLVATIRASVAIFRWLLRCPTRAQRQHFTTHAEARYW